MNLNKVLTLAGIVLLMLYSTQSTQAQIRTLKGGSLSSEKIDSFISRQMDSLKIPALSFAIIQDGKVAYYKASGVKNYKYEPVDSTTVFEAASMTKTVFAYAVHQLVQKGLLSLDTPLYKYCPYKDIAHDERYKLITARMVLGHCTGFPNWRNGSELRIMFEPGSKFGYSGEGFEYLAMAIENLLQKKIDRVITEEVFGPFSISNPSLSKDQYILDHLADGMRDNIEWGWNNAWKEPHVAFGLCTEAREYAKFVIGLMKESRSATAVFTQMSAQQMQTAPNTWVCLGMFMEQTPYGTKYFHSGNNNNRFNSNFEFYKERDLGYVFFMNCHQEPAFTKRWNEFLENGN